MTNYRHYITNPCVEIFLPTDMIKEITVVPSDTMVDGEKWYTIFAGRESSAWLRNQDCRLWYETHGRFNVNMFDIHNELLIIMKLKWAT